MLPTNIFYRTFFIRAAQYGTAFTLEIDGAEFLITAAHLLGGYARMHNLQILRSGLWHSVDCEVVAVGKGALDIAVLRVPTRLTDPAFAVEPKFGDCYVGQDMFFVGFPYKMWVDYGPNTDGQPGVFLKKGTLSAVEAGPPKLLYVDALNNEGFSGAPLYYFKNGNLNELPCIAGVVSKYKVEHEAVLDGKGESTDMTVPYNTGFMVAYSIAHALELARR
jgi:Trypsin-like peptidase domain